MMQRIARVCQRQLSYLFCYSITQSFPLIKDFICGFVCIYTWFYPLGASDARVLAVIVCLCVCRSHAGIVSKRLNVEARKQHHVIAQGF